MLVQRGLTLEYITLGWNVVGVGVLAVAAIAARSVALGGFGLDSLVEIGASTVVVWELSDSSELPFYFSPSIWRSRAQSCLRVTTSPDTVHSGLAGPWSRRS